MAFRAKQRGGTAASLASVNEVLLSKELCFETDTGLYKLGDGVTPWNALPYFQLQPVFSGPVTLDAVPNPSPPGAGKMRMYAHEIAGRMFPKVLGPSGLDNPLQCALFANRTAAMLPGATTTPQYLGLIAASGVGTVSHPTLVTGVDLNSTTARIRTTGTATANSAAELRFAQAMMYRGEVFGAVPVGGFFTATRFCVPVAVANQRVFVGLANTTAAISVTQDPDLLTNIVGVGWDSADTTLQLFYNDAAGNASRINLGASFPANTIAAVYELILFCAPNGDSIGYRVKRLDVDATASGVLTTDIPAKTTTLTWHAYVNNGGTAASPIIDVHRFYMETDY